MAEPVVPAAVVPPVVPEHNPYAPYGLDTSGNPLPAPKVEAANPLDAKVAALETKIAGYESQIKGQTDVAKKMEIVDRVIKAFAPDDPSTKQYKEIFEDLKKVVPPGLRKAFELLEQNPDALDQLSGSLNALHVDRLVTLNTQAHDRVTELAKKAGFRGKDSAEMNKMVFPYERAITEVISANPQLKKAFVSGNIDVIDEVFNSLVAPHVAQRLREKQSRLKPATVRTPPFGKAAPGEGKDTPVKPDIRTPQGRAAFHKQAVGRFFDKASARDDE